MSLNNQYCTKVHGWTVATLTFGQQPTSNTVISRDRLLTTSTIDKSGLGDLGKQVGLVVTGGLLSLLILIAIMMFKRHGRRL